MVVNYAVEVQTGTSVDSANLGITDGFIRMVTGRPTYDGSTTIPLGDNSQFSVTIDGLESIGTAFQSGQLYDASNGSFKTASTVPSVNMRFTVLGTNDFTGGELATAKGSAPESGDIFEVTANGSGSEAVQYEGVNRWYNDFIIKDGLSNPNRRVDLSKTGDYGTLSGFNFTIRNDNKYWNSMDSNTIYLINREVRVYAVLDDVFYQIWTGVVANNPFDETDFKFICQDNFKNIHKQLPPTKITDSNYSSANDDSKGSAVPVAFGNVPYAKLMNIGGSATILPMLFTAGGTELSKAVAATAYSETDNTVTLTLQLSMYGYVAWKTNSGYSDAAGDVGNYYIKAIHDGGSGNGDTEELIQVVGTAYDAGNDRITFTLDKPITGLATDGSSALCTVSGVVVTVTTSTWYFNLIKLVTDSVLTNTSPSNYYGDDYDDYRVYEWDDKAKKYTNIENIVKEIDTTVEPEVVRVINSDMTFDGDIKTLMYYKPELVGTTGTGGTIITELEKTIDRDRSTSTEIMNEEWGGGTNTSSTDVYVKIPSHIIDTNISRLWLVFDLDYTVTPDSGDVNVQNFNITDPRTSSPYSTGTFGFVSNTSLFSESSPVIAPHRETPSTSTYDINMIPNDYYRNAKSGNGANSESSVWQGLTESDENVQTKMEIQASELQRLVSNYGDTTIRLTFNYQAEPVVVGENYTIQSNLKQVAIIAEKVLDFSSSSLYMSIDGESGADTVDGVFTRILETYDGISSSDIDYGNLATTRNTWYVGRQITERDDSSRYLKELCEQSFVAMFPTRDGKRGLSAWRDNETSVATLDQDSIVRGSIRNWTRTKLYDLYNNFNVEYSFNPGLNKMDKTLSIDYTDQGTFPAADTVDPDNSNLKLWYKYFGGLSDNSYSDAKELWEICEQSYDRTKHRSQLPNSLGQLTWYSDRAKLGLTTGIGVDSSAYKFLQYAVEWLTRQKETVEFRIPMSAANIVLELANYITFADTIYTNASNRVGWIQSIEVDTRKDQIVIGAILEPSDIVEFGDIIETGSQTDTITESGSQSDTYTEGA